MIPNLSRSLRCLAATALAAVAVGCPTGEPRLEELVSYHQRGSMTGLTIHLDSMGILAAPGRSAEEVESAAAEFGFRVVRRQPGGFFVASLAQPADHRQEQFNRGRAMYLQRPDAIENAGPLARPASPSGSRSASRDPVMLTDQFIVLFHREVTEARIDSLVQAHRAEALEVSNYDDRRRLFRVTPDSPGDVLVTSNAFSVSPLTEWSYPDLVRTIRPDEFIPNDPHFGVQWHLKNGTTGSTGDINATLAWDLTRGSQSVVIAVMEPDGFDANHPDLLGNLWVNDDPPGDADSDGDPDDDGNGFVDDVHGWSFQSCVNATDPCDGTDLSGWAQEHGTAVAGLIAASTDNGTGIAGVCPECKLMLLVLGGGDWRREAAFEYAANEGASIVNASWTMDRGEPIETAIRYAATTGRNGRGAVVVFSSGKIDEEVCVTPDPNFTSMDEVLAVSSSDELDKRVAPSGYGDCLDLLAPGGFDQDVLGVTSTDKMGVGSYNDGVAPSLCSSTAPDLTDADYTKCFGGTSAAAAIVSGVAGLILSANPLLTRDEVREILIETAEKVDCSTALYGGSASCPSDPYAFSSTHGYGRVDAYAAVQVAAGVTVGPATASITGRLVGCDDLPLMGAVVTILELEVGAVADSNGRFLIKGVPPGTWTVQVAQLGHGLHTISVMVEAGDTIDLGDVAWGCTGA